VRLPPPQPASKALRGDTRISKLSANTAILSSYSSLTDAEAGQVITTSPEPMWIKDPFGRALWNNGKIPKCPLTDIEARVLETGNAEVIPVWNGERDRQVIVFRATIQGLPVLVGYSLPV